MRLLVKIRVQRTRLRQGYDVASPGFGSPQWGMPLITSTQVRSCPFFQDHISKKIPQDIAATHYLGFTPMNP